MKTNHVSLFVLPINRRFLFSGLLSLFVSVVTFYSQNLNLAQHSYQDDGGKVVYHRGNLYYAVSVYMPFTDSAFICSVDKNLKGRFRKLIQKHAVTTILDMKVTLDRNIAVLGRHKACDYVDNNSKYFLMKIDTNGNTMIDISFANITGSSKSATLFQDKDSSFVVRTEKSIYLLNKSGQLISSWSSGSANMYGMYRSPNKESVISSQVSGSNQLVHLDALGSQINQVNVPYLASSFERFSSGALVLLLNNGSLMKLDSSLSTLSSLSVAPGSSISTMSTQRDTLYLGGTAPQGKPFIMVCDSALNVISQYTCASESMQVSSVAPLKGLEAAMIIDLVLPVTIHTGIIKTSNNGSFNYTKDIGVSNASIIDSYTSKNYSYVNVNYNSNVTVKNFGNDTVNSFYLNAQLIGTSLCHPYVYHSLIQNIVLPPQGTITFSTGFITQIVDEASSPVKPSYTLDNVCFYTSAPNYESDAVRSNDGFCMATQTIRVTEVSEVGSLSDLKIFPNPFSDVINLDEIHSEKEVRIYDLSSRQVFGVQLSDEENQVHPSLPSGAYILEIYSDGKHTMRKLFRE